jgi:hypothetical protein
MKKLHKRYFLLLAVLFAMFFGVADCQARNVPIVEGKVTIFLPDSWRNAYEGGVITTESPDGGVAIVFSIIENNQLDEAVVQAEASIIETLGPIRHNGDIVEFTVNGMPATMQKGVSQNGQTAFSLTMVLTPTEKWLMIMYMGQKRQEAIWRSYLNDILNGVKPVR